MRPLLFIIKSIRPKLQPWYNAIRRLPFKRPAHAPAKEALLVSGSGLAPVNV
jgi:hypothetical protein